MPHMDFPPPIITNVSRARVRPLLVRLTDLFEEMDRAYDRAARHYKFECRGCADNCCKTLFYHHTTAEFLYLQAGLKLIDATNRSAIIDRAREYDAHMTVAGKTDDPVRLMCPLNVAERCIMYQHRPMICRMHGLAYDLNPPAGKPETKTIRGPGCDAFTAQCGQEPYFELDRTPFYQRLATLERELRQAIGFKQKLKMTVVRMLMEIDRMEIDRTEPGGLS